MKKYAIIAAFAAALTSAPAFAQALDDNQAQGSATAEVIAPITVTHVSGAALNFGQFAATRAGTVTVTQTGTRTSADVDLAAGSVPSADSFTVAGDRGRAFSIATSSSNVVTHADGDTMTFTVDAPTTGTLSSPSSGNGTANFNVGGALAVVAGQKAGDYTGSYTVTVNYD